MSVQEASRIHASWAIGGNGIAMATCLSALLSGCHMRETPSAEQRAEFRWNAIYLLGHLHRDCPPATTPAYEKARSQQLSRLNQLRNALSASVFFEDLDLAEADFNFRRTVVRVDCAPPEQATTEDVQQFIRDGDRTLGKLEELTQLKRTGN